MFCFLPRKVTCFSPNSKIFSSSSFHRLFSDTYQVSELLIAIVKKADRITYNKHIIINALNKCTEVDIKAPYGDDINFTICFIGYNQYVCI